MSEDIRYQNMLAYLAECPALSGILNFQAYEQKKTVDGVQIIAKGGNTDRTVQYIDGSKLRQFDFTICFYKPVTSNPYVASKGSGNVNLSALLDVQSMIQWLDAQNKSYHFPDFGDMCDVDNVKSLNTEPHLSWIDTTNHNPPLAQYTVTVRVEYIDNTDRI